jgi:acetylornithine deacetylase/succinyl-diaminopimelate desuccinylase-like protein
VRQEAYFPTWLLEEEHPLVQAGLEAAHLATGRKARSGFWSFSTNGVATAGRHRIPTIGFAPGEEALAHTSRERVLVEDLLREAQFYALLPFVLAERIAG